MLGVFQHTLTDDFSGKKKFYFSTVVTRLLLGYYGPGVNLYYQKSHFRQKKINKKYVWSRKTFEHSDDGNTAYSLSI